MRPNSILGRLAALTLVLTAVISIQSSGSAAAQNDQRYFSESGFRVDNDAIWSFFSGHGGPRAFGLPISRSFKLHGYPTQIFERHVLALTDSGEARVVSLLDSGWMPYTQILNRPIPAYDAGLTATAPAGDSESYVDDMYAYVQANLPDTLDGYATSFFRMFSDTMAPIDQEGVEPILVKIAVLQNLDIWGIPTSRPLRDLLRSGVVSIRMERGVLRFDAACQCTSPLPLGSYFKAVLTGNELPADLEQQAPDSPYLRQYDVGTNIGPYRDWQLPNTDLSYAFLPSLEYPQSSSIPVPEVPLIAPTSTPLVRPTSAAASVAPAGPTATATPAPLPPTPLNRQPYQVVLQRPETGRETTLMLSQTGEDARALWQSVRFERDRNPESNGLGPNIFHNTVYVARTIDSARQIYSEQVQVQSFPEAVDRFGAVFPLARPSLGEESYVLASCVEEGCSGTTYNIHLRLVFRTANIVSVLYTYGDQNSSSLDSVVFVARHISDRMGP
jgi:hypothetical protein